MLSGNRADAVRLTWEPASSVTARRFIDDERMLANRPIVLPSVRPSTAELDRTLLVGRPLGGGGGDACSSASRTAMAFLSSSQQGAWIDIRIRDTRTSVTHCCQRGSFAVVHRQPL